MAEQIREDINLEMQFLHCHKGEYFKLYAIHNESGNSPKTSDLDTLSILPIFSYSLEKISEKKEEIPKNY